MSERRFGAARSTRHAALALLFFVALGAVLVTNVYAYRHFQASADANPPDRRSTGRAHGLVLRPGVPRSLAEAAAARQDRGIEREFFESRQGYYRLGEVLQGREVRAPRDANLREREWRRVALVPLAYVSGERRLAPEVSSMLRDESRERVGLGALDLLLVFEPDSLAFEPVHLYRDSLNEREWFAVPESRLPRGQRAH